MLKHPFHPAAFFLLRIPVWPVEKSQDLFSNHGNWMESLLQLYDNDELLREAVAIASPALHRSLRERSNKPENLLKMATSLSNYVIRMSTRPTPFGLFSCVSSAGWADHTNISYDIAQLSKKVRCDMEWYYSLVQKVYKDEEHFKQLTVRRNPFIELSDRYSLKYVCSIENNNAQSEIISIRASKLVGLIFELSKEPILVVQLLEGIQKNMQNLKEDGILQVLQQLSIKQFLLPAILPSLLEVPSTQSLFEKINPYSSTASLGQQLLNYSNLRPGKGEESLLKLQQEMSSISSHQKYIQVDSVYETKADHFVLSRNVADELQHALTILWKIASIQPHTSPLTAYHQRFVERYGLHRIVPLSELLHDERGLGSFEEPSESQQSELSSNWESWLHGQWQECLFQNREEWVITERQIEPFLVAAKIKPHDLSHACPSLDVFCKIIASSKNSLDKGEFLTQLTGVSTEGCSVFGRFLDVLGDQTKNNVSQFLTEEEKLEPQSLFVELSYWPIHVRGANVAIQPCLRRYRLDLETEEFKAGYLSLEDIYVGANTEKFFLTLKDGKTDIVIRVGNLLNFQSAPAHIKFMRYVALARFQPLSVLSWGRIAETAAFLPRIKFQKTVLSPAQWNFDSRFSVNEKVENILPLFDSWAAFWKLPERFFLVRGDQHLLLDRTFERHRLDIRDKIKKGNSLTFVENIEGAWIQGTEGHHVCEIAVPFIRNSHLATKPQIINFRKYDDIPTSERFRLPGSDWLYVKFYLGKGVFDHFLVNHLQSLTNHLTDRISQSYFVRYGDPRPHIRYRVKLRAPEAISSVLLSIHDFSKEWMEMGLIGQMMIVPYEREVERYGGAEVIGAAEDLFCSDSASVLYLLSLLLKKQFLFDEVVLQTLSIMMFCKDMGFGQDYMIALNQDRKALKGFRQYKDQLIRFASILNDENHQSVSNDIICMKNASSIRALAIRDFHSKTSQLPENSRFSIHSSLLHMHCNRLGCDAISEKRSLLYAQHTLNQLKRKELESATHSHLR